MRPCTYTVTRHKPKQRRQGHSHDNDSDEDGMSSGTHPGTTSDINTSPATAVRKGPAHNDSQGPVSADLNDTVMTTVVSNGNDALNLLFEAAQREERVVNGVRVSASVNSHIEPPSTNISSGSLPELSFELTETWNAYRFVRMGWLSAEEIVWFLEMYDQCCTLHPRYITNFTARFYKNIAPLCPILDDCKYYCVDLLLFGLTDH